LKSISVITPSEYDAEADEMAGIDTGIGIELAVAVTELEIS
jgi:hypothetical protein